MSHPTTRSSLRRLIDNLKLWQKFALIGILALVMAGIPATLAVRHNLAAVAAARAEAAGIGPAHQALGLLQATQQLRGLSAGFLGGNDAMGAPRQAKQGEVERALQATLDALQANPALAGLAAQVQAMGRDLAPLAGAVAAKSIPGPDSFARHTALIDTQLQLLEAIVDASTLGLDPEAASNQAIRAVFDYLPALTEQLGQARARGSAILARGSASPADRLAVSVLGSLARYNAQKAESALRKAIAAHPPLAASLERPLAAAIAQAGAGLGLMDKEVVSADPPSFASGGYFDRMTVAIDAQFDLIGTAFAALDSMLSARVQDRQRELAMVTTAMAALVAVALAVMVLITRSTAGSMQRAVQVARTVASGDLTSTIDAHSSDETGQMLQALKDMNASLTRLVGQVRQGTDAIAAAAGQIAAGNQDLSSRTEQQASSLEETAASMEQMAGTVAQNSEHAQQAYRLARSAADVARDGGQAVARVVETMESISSSSSKIADIVGIIDGIAFQTNILALNAAVEAARAGEQGRGFAVVAGEVRTLAQRSAAAAKDIKTLIQESVHTVQTGGQTVGEAGRIMDGVVESIGRVADIMAEINAASEEQARGVEQINQAVSQMDQVTQQNAALVEEAAAAAQAMQDQVGELVGAVGRFRVGVVEVAT